MSPEKTPGPFEDLRTILDYRPDGKRWTEDFVDLVMCGAAVGVDLPAAMVAGLRELAGEMDRFGVGDVYADLVRRLTADDAA